MNIRPVNDHDIERITDIYNWYILNTIITFELTVIRPEDMYQRVHEKLRTYDWIVGEVDHEIVGYAYYGAFHARAAYNHTVETTIYLAQNHLGKGFGTSLYRELIDLARAKNFRELIGIIALPNSSSTTLHHKLGFREVGMLQKVGYKFNRYIDVGIWQKSIE